MPRGTKRWKSAGFKKRQPPLTLDRLRTSRHVVHGFVNRHACRVGAHRGRPERSPRRCTRAELRRRRGRPERRQRRGGHRARQRRGLCGVPVERPTRAVPRAASGVRSGVGKKDKLRNAGIDVVPLFVDTPNEYYEWMNPDCSPSTTAPPNEPPRDGSSSDSCSSCLWS